MSVRQALHMKTILKFLVNVIIGATLLFFLNRLCSGTDFTVPLNAYTILCAGILGVPGVALLISIKYII